MHTIIHFQIFLLVVLAAHVPAALAEVTWDSPTVGDVYTPGDTLQAVWTSPDKVVSPSFTICTVDNSTSASDDPDCGTAVWPAIEQNGTEYSISLGVPNITRNGEYYLVMKDDLGTVYDTPNFSLALTKVDNTTANTNATSSVTTTEPTGNSINYLPSHSAPTVAAIAIPLSLVAATLLVALLLLLCRLRRSRQREKDKQREIRASEKMGSQQSALSFASAADIERAVLALASVRGYGGPGPHAYRPPQPSPGMNAGAPFTAQSLSAAAAAAALGLGAFGWAHGFGQPPHAAPAISDAYTPAPVPQYATSTGSVSNHPHTTPLAPAAAPPQSQSETIRHDQQTVPGPVHWNDTEKTFVDAPSTSLQAPSHAPLQPLAIRVHASSPPPPPPPKQLFPGSPLAHTPRVYEPPYSSLPPVEEATPTPGANAHASLNVISNYMHASPALPQGDMLLVPPSHDFQPPRPPPPSLTRVRSLRRLETIEETEKPLPTRPEDRIGTDLYDAVSRAVGG